jgi:hypothetical protein
MFIRPCSFGREEVETGCCEGRQGGLFGARGVQQVVSMALDIPLLAREFEGKPVT